MSSPTTQMPAAFIASIAAGRPPTSAIGRYSIAPAAALVTVGVTCTARCLGSTTPVTPAHSAMRMSAPRFPGSVTPSTASRNGAPPSPSLQSWSSSGLGQLGRSATTPWGASVWLTSSSFGG